MALGQPRAQARHGSVQKQQASFTNSVFITLAFEAGLFVVSFASSVVTARLLGPAGRGEFALVTTTVALISTCGQIGLSHSIVYHARRFPPGILERSSLSLALGLGVATVVVVSTVGWKINRHLYAFDALSGGVLIAALPLLFVANAALSIVQARYEILRFNVLRASAPIVFLGSLLAFAAMITDALLAALAAWIVAQSCFLVIGLAYAKAGIAPPTSEDLGIRRRWSQLLRFGAKAYAGNVLKHLQYRFDLLMVGFLLERSEVGYYAVALTFGEILWRLPNSIGSVLLPRIARSANHEDLRLTPVIARGTLTITAILAVLLAIVAPFAVTVTFGNEFRPALAAFRLLLPGVVALAVWKILANDLIGRGHARAFSASALGSAIVMVAGDLLLIPRIGIEGAAIAGSAAYVTATAVLVTVYMRVTGTNARDLLVPSCGDAQRFVRLLSRMTRKLAHAHHAK